MKRHYFFTIALLLLLSNGIVMAQNNEKERLKSNLENAFAPKKTDDTATKVENTTPSADKNGQTLYYVQLFYSKNPDPAREKKAKTVFSQITSYKHNGYIKYCIGGFSTQKEAEPLMKKAKANGYPSAFIITLKDGKRID